MPFMGNKIRHFPLILLAGGKSSRMGTPKGLLEYRGNLWLIEQFKRFKAASGGRAIVILGFHHEHYFEKIPWLRTAGNQPVHQLGLNISVVINPNPEYGQFSSLKCAIAFLQNEDFPGVFVHPVDVPSPKKEVYEKLSRAFNRSVSAAIPRHRYKGGHPVLLSHAFLDRLAEISPSSAEVRLDLQIQALPRDQVAFVPVDDESVCLNMNFLDEFRSYSN